MKKFYYFLQDSPNRPFEINAISKAEVKSLIMESVPDESHILAIYTSDEFDMKYNGKQTKTRYQTINEEDDSDYNNSYANSSDFFNSMLSEAKNSTNNKIESNNIKQNNDNQIGNIFASENKIQQIDNSPKYFEDEGISFKFENGKLYRKRWRNIKDLSEKIEYRILRSKTGKECDKDIFEIEILDWVEFQEM